MVTLTVLFNILPHDALLWVKLRAQRLRLCPTKLGDQARKANLATFCPIIIIWQVVAQREMSTPKLGALTPTPPHPKPRPLRNLAHAVEPTQPAHSTSSDRPQPSHDTPNPQTAAIPSKRTLFSLGIHSTATARDPTVGVAGCSDSQAGLESCEYFMYVKRTDQQHAPL
jgi:hypothetical protein